MGKYVQIIPKFGGLNTLLAPHVLGPAGAQLAHDVDVTTGILQQVVNDEVRGSAAWLDLHDWNTYLIGTNTALSPFPAAPHVYAEYGNRIMRSVYAPDALAIPPQYAAGPASASPTWDILSIAAPATACTATPAAGALTGTYSWYVTFINTLGDESAPSPVATATLAAQQGNLSAIPISYGNGSTTNGSTAVTAVANINSFRVGMRVTSTAGIQAETYITAINTGASTMTLSKNATATGARILQDAQVTGRRIYRSGGTRSIVSLVTELSDVTTTTYNDNTADTSLGEEITTADYDTFPAGGGLAVSSAGVIMFVARGSVNGQGDEVHFSEAGKPWAYKADNYITVSEPAVYCSYGIDRFLVHTRGSLNVVVGTDSTDFELLVAQGEPAPVYTHGNYTAFGQAVQYQGAMWFTSMSGAMRYDGQSVECITRGVFTRAQNKVLHIYMRGMCIYGDRLIIMTALNQSTADNQTRVLLSYDPRVGWSTSGEYTTGAYNAYSYGGIVYLPYDGANLYQDQVVIQTSTEQIYLADQPSFGTSQKKLGGYYRAGDWHGENLGGLKKLRGVALTYVGQPQISIYIDNVITAGSPYLPAAASVLAHEIINLPPETQGRTFGVRVDLNTTYVDAVYDLGILVGEERPVYP